MRRFFHRRPVLAILVGLFAGWLVLGLFLPLDLCKSTRHYIRNHDGMLVSADKRVFPVTACISAKASKLLTDCEYNGGDASYCMSAPVAISSVEIHVQSNHALAYRIAESLLKELQKIPTVSEVWIYPAKYKPAAGSRLCDLHITIDTDHVRVINLLLWRSVSCKVTCGAYSTISPMFDDVSSLTLLGDNPELSGIQSFGSMNFLGRNVGIALWRPWYESEGEVIAARIGASLREQCEVYINGQGALDPLPDCCYPAHIPAPAFPFLSTYGAKVVFDHSAMLAPTMTKWQCVSDKPSWTTLGEIMTQYTADGWERYNVNGGFREKLAGFGLKKGNRYLSFRLARHTHEFTVTYLQTVDRTTLHHIIDQLFSRGISTTTLTAFQRAMSSQQKKRFVTLLSNKKRTYTEAMVYIHCLHELDQHADAKIAFIQMVADQQRYRQEQGIEQGKIDNRIAYYREMVGVDEGH